MKAGGVLAAAIFSIACLPVAPPATVEPPPPSATSTVCTESPAGLALDVRLVGAHGVQVLGRGFEPGEPLSMILTAEIETATGRQGVRHEIQPAQKVRPDGTFIIDADLQPLGDGVTWHVAVVHRRGVACAAFFAP